MDFHCCLIDVRGGGILTWDMLPACLGLVMLQTRVKHHLSSSAHLRLVMSTCLLTSLQMAAAEISSSR